MRYLGAHLSTAGGVSKAFERAQTAGCTALQIFTKNNNQWAAKPLDPAEIERFNLQRKATGIDKVTAHASYLINIATNNPELWDKSLRALIDELQRCEQLDISGLVLHPGAHTGCGEDAGLSNVVNALNEAHAALPGYKVKTLLEITAGQGTCLGHRFEHLAAIRDRVAQPERLGCCFDTCHVFAAGYELRTSEGYQQTMADLDRTFGLDGLLCFHFNDSKKGLGSRVDRHEHIGKGELGLEPFRLILNDPRFVQHPILLETPLSEDLHEAIENLAVLRSLIPDEDGNDAKSDRPVSLSGETTV